MQKLGFGFLRIPFSGEEVNYPLLNEMVDTFLAKGGRVFDTAPTYLEGKSEEAIRKAVVERHPRDSFFLSNKLPGYRAKCYEDCMQLFETSARLCGVDYFDLYLLHWLNPEHYALAEKYREFDFLQALKDSGKAKRIGFSYHGTPELLETILCAHPEVDCVLLQINYLDWESAGIQSRLCYETVLRHGKAVWVMEPVKGGALASPPEEAAELLKQIDPASSPAKLAIRFVQSLAGTETVLSGMNSMEQLLENLSPSQPLTQQEQSALLQAAEVIRSKTAVACTGCGYCLKTCPKKIPIPKIFTLFNEYSLMPRHLWKLGPAYHAVTENLGSASSCIGCKSCEKNCPQKLPIAEHIQAAAEVFESK